VAHVHIGGECVESFIKVIHLNHYAEANHYAKDISADVDKLIIASEGELHGDAEAFDRHDRD